MKNAQSCIWSIITKLLMPIRRGIMKYKGIIFDFNGTLFFDSKKHLEAWREFSKRIRKTAFTDEEMREHMFGRTNKDIIAYAAGRELPEDVTEKLAAEKEALYRDMCRNDKENLKLATGAAELLDFLKNNNIPRTIATMSDKANVDFYIESFNLDRWFDIDKIVYSDGTIKGKPAPDIYLIAAAKLNLQPKECIVAEDALSGIEAAKAAEIGKIIAIASMDEKKVYENIPYIDMIIKDFNEFDRNLFEYAVNV